MQGRDDGGSGGPAGVLHADVQRLREDLPTLEAVERRRGQLWAVAGVLLLASSSVVFLLIADPDAARILPDNVGIRLGFGGLSLAFLLYVFDQERRLRVLSEALVRERVLSTALTSRVRDLGTLSRVGHIVNAVLSTEEVLEVVLDGAFELTGGVRGSVMLVDGDHLEVAVAAGADRAPVGRRQPMSAGVAGWVATMREPVLITGRVAAGQFDDLQDRAADGGSSVIAPMLVADELVGILALERSPDAEAFTEWEMRAVTLFAAHAATAVANSQRYERERQNVERLAELVERRGDEVARMVHDLKAPLTAILGFAALVRRRPMPPEQQLEVLERLEHAGRQLLVMIEEVLRGASEEALADVRRDPVDLVPLVHELAEVTAGLARGRDGVERQVRVHAEPPAVVAAVDTGMVRSVLVNLLENAVKYSPPGTPVDLEISRSSHEVRLAVRDRGPGVPPDEREAIFERFRQRDGDGAAGGVGLGLYIVRSLVNAHGGRVEVRSVPGDGATFTVTLPAGVGAGTPTGPPGPVTGPGDTPIDLRGVDDDDLGEPVGSTDEVR
ncbi:MAG: ATP-binding protein [Actinomycetes bacterium]